MVETSCFGFAISTIHSEPFPLKWPQHYYNSGCSMQTSTVSHVLWLLMTDCRMYVSWNSYCDQFCSGLLRNKVWWMSRVFPRIQTLSDIKRRTGCAVALFYLVWGRVSEVVEQRETHIDPPSTLHTHTNTKWCIALVDMLPSGVCFCGNEAWFMFYCLEMSRHLSKLCWANGRMFQSVCLFFMTVSTSPLLLFSPAHTRHKIE